MGSPETCPTCGSDDRAVRLMAGNVNDRYPCLHGWHKGTPTPPAPADDALPRVSEYEMNIPTHETPEEHLDRIRGHDAPDDAEARGCTVAFCETHRDVEILPGPFCPVCLGATCRADGARDGLTARRPAAHAGGAEAMRERAARAAAARCQEYADDFNRRGGSPDRISTAAFLRDEVAGAIRALPLPARDDAVEEARKAFAASGSAWARHQFECPGAAFEGPGAEWFAENDALRSKAIHDHDALLAAERDAALRAKGGA